MIIERIEGIVNDSKYVQCLGYFWFLTPLQAAINWEERISRIFHVPMVSRTNCLYYLPDFPAKNLQIFYTAYCELISLILIIQTSELLFENHITNDLNKLYIKRFLYTQKFHISLPGTLGRSQQTSQSSWRARRLSVSGSTLAPAPGRSALVAPPAAVLGPPFVRSALTNPQDSRPKWSHFVRSPTTRGKIKLTVFV
jgi:hypothetical protein